MSITKIIKKFHSNRVQNIKNMSNGVEKDLAIGSLVADLGKRSISAICKVIGCCFRKVKKCYDEFINGIQLSIEFRGRKRIEYIYPNIKNDIESVIEKYKNVDPSFKTERLYISVNPTTIIDELIDKFNYPPKFASYNTINRILKEMGYKIHKIPKSEVVGKIPETDAIFENVNNEMESALKSDDETSVMSIDDKTSKKIGKISDNGKTYIDVKGLDHDTLINCSMKPFGILDLKTNETFVTCTPFSSTAEFKVSNIENYIIQKNKIKKQKKLIIFLDNGPENSGRRTLWLKELVRISKQYNIVIKLVYYPPYHSKYNLIERFWARLQIFWNRIIMDTEEKLIEVLNKVTWKSVKCSGSVSFKHYDKGIKVSDIEMNEKINPHIIREEGLEKWSIVITPWAN